MIPLYLHASLPHAPAPVNWHATKFLFEMATNGGRFALHELGRWLERENSRRNHAGIVADFPGTNRMKNQSRDKAARFQFNFGLFIAEPSAPFRCLG